LVLYVNSGPATPTIHGGQEASRVESIALDRVNTKPWLISSLSQSKIGYSWEHFPYTRLTTDVFDGPEVVMGEVDSSIILDFAGHRFLCLTVDEIFDDGHVFHREEDVIELQI
jgi:hypothetical protein